MKTDIEIQEWLDSLPHDRIYDPSLGSLGFDYDDMPDILRSYAEWTNGGGVPAPVAPSPTKTLFERLVAGEIAIDMRGNENWGNRVQKLCGLLKAAAPKDASEPRFTFYSFYYIDGKLWYATEFLGNREAVDPLKIEIHE